MGESIHVLVIDDEPELLTLARLFLDAQGLSVTTAEGVRPALSLLDTTSFDAIVSDYYMPEMDGIELLTLLKSRGDTTPFIIYTGRGREEVVINALNKGADFYIQKTGEPKAEFAELVSKIRYAVLRKRSEKELERALSYLKKSQEVAHIGSWTLNCDTRLFTASEESLRISGFPPGHQPTMEEIESTIHPDDLTLAKESLQILKETGRPYNIDLRIFRKDTGKMRYIQSQAQKLEGDPEERDLILGTTLDITERKKIEETVRETNLFLENLISIASVPILIWDPGFSITRINQAGEELLGRSAEDLIGTELHHLFTPEMAGEAMNQIRSLTGGKSRITVGTDVLHADGSVRTVLWNIAALYDGDDHTPVATIAQGQDITARLLLEHERDTAEIQIQQNLAQLAILNDGIRNPLMVISGYAELSGDPDLADKIRMQVDEINQMVTKVDRRWAESEKILKFLRKHSEFSDSR